MDLSSVRQYFTQCYIVYINMKAGERGIKTNKHTWKSLHNNKKKTTSQDPMKTLGGFYIFILMCVYV